MVKCILNAAVLKNMVTRALLEDLPSPAVPSVLVGEEARLSVVTMQHASKQHMYSELPNCQHNYGKASHRIQANPVPKT